MKKKIDPLERKECHRCGFVDAKKHMYHMQYGFGALWFCRNRAACEKRQKKVKKALRPS